MRWMTGFWIVMGAWLLIGCGEELPLEEKIVTHPGRGSVWKKYHFQITPQRDTLIQGAYQEFYWDATPALSTIYKDGKPQGSSQAWYESGELKWTKNYDAGQPKGAWRLYSMNGQNWGEVVYLNGKREGQAKCWVPE
jgi:hypothetical protein